VLEWEWETLQQLTRKFVRRTNPRLFLEMIHTVRTQEDRVLQGRYRDKKLLGSGGVVWWGWRHRQLT